MGDEGSRLGVVIRKGEQDGGLWDEGLWVKRAFGMIFSGLGGGECGKKVSVTRELFGILSFWMQTHATVGDCPTAWRDRKIFLSFCEAQGV